MEEEISIKVIDREENTHLIKIPTDMGFNLMEALKVNNLPVEGICGGIALCASCQCYINSKHNLKKKLRRNKQCLQKHQMLKKTVVLLVK